MKLLTAELCETLHAVLDVDARRRHILGTPDEGIAYDYAQAAANARTALHRYHHTAERAFSKEEERLLLYLETCAVDYGGSVDGLLMNPADHEIAIFWRGQHFIGFGRIMAEHIRGSRPFWVTLSPEAWCCAHRLRIERSARMMSKRTWRTTSEESGDLLPFTIPVSG